MRRLILGALLVVSFTASAVETLSLGDVGLRQHTNGTAFCYDVDGNRYNRDQHFIVHKNNHAYKIECVGNYYGTWWSVTEITPDLNKIILNTPIPKELVDDYN